MRSHPSPVASPVASASIRVTPSRSATNAVSLTLGAMLLMLTAGCSPTETVVETVVVDQEALDNESEAEPADPFEVIVAGMNARGAAGAEEAWAKDRPTLLLFAASW
jgi:hypothetical protein